MANKRTASRIPLEQPFLVDKQLDTSWMKWLITISDNVPKYTKHEVSVNVPSVSANTTLEHTFTLEGVASNDFVTVSKPSHTTGLGITNVRVSAINTIAITYMNNTGSPIDPSAETYTLKVENL